MTNARIAAAAPSPALLRLTALGPLSDMAVALIGESIARQRNFTARQEILTEGQALGEPRILLSGWACCVRMFADGRRQILGLLVPGDLIGLSNHRAPVAPASVIALTSVTLGLAPSAEGPDLTDLAEVYEISRVLEHFHLLNQIARLGRLTAYERVADLMLELNDRLAPGGLADAGRFPLPLTQEVVADVLGLTSVHVNRTIKALRHDGVLTLQGGSVTIHDPATLAAQIEHWRPRIAAT